MAKQTVSLFFIISVIALIALAVLLLFLPKPAAPQAKPAETTTTLPPDTIAIERAAQETIVVRNTGSIDIRTAEIVVYLDGILTDCLWSAPVMQPQRSATCTLQGTACADKSVRVVGPSSEQRTRC